MFLKRIIALVLCVALLLIVSTLVVAKGGGQGMNQTGMETPTPMDQTQATPFPDLPLSGAQTDMSTCPMMSGAGMTGSMSGMNMGGMTGMPGTSGMQGAAGMNMGTMPGMSMTGVGGVTMNLSTPWYSNPWLLLGWVLLTLVILAILIGIVLGITQITRRSRSSESTEKA